MSVAAIKTATKKAIQHLGGIDAAATISRVGRSQLSDYGNRNSPQVVPVDVAVDLDTSAQEPLILAAMAHAEGFRLVPVKISGTGHIPKELAKFSKFSSEVLQEGIESLEDGRVDVAEAAVFNGITNGNIDKTYTIRKKILSCWLMYPGSLINQMQLTFTQGQFAQVETDVISANETLSEADIASAELPAPTGIVHNTVDNFLGVTLLGKPISGCVTSATITLARNGSKAEYGNGHADACGVNTGQLEASGSLSFYFRSWDAYQDALSAKQGPVVLKTVDSAGNGYAFVFLNAALRNPQAQTDAVNKSYELKLDIEGNPSATGGTFAIFRLAPPAS
ncbi:hypothetical protein AmDm5_0494 [Acetobacter malorum]|uniref:Phage minor tail protein n=1 Tax=Acetobacter malorum TaxID=178901 RepID=A0A087PXF0_9PROT|nr:phage tail tube protein [Acetobacter malorum]KFL92053.1 hypothetical protein AmDm5_0494 [Acetobacter malorum]OAG78489.1 phage minor tail protein [Acetobacter malorum]